MKKWILWSSGILFIGIIGFFVTTKFILEAQPVTDKQQAFLKKIYQEASKGKVIDVNPGIGATKKEVIHTWGTSKDRHRVGQPKEHGEVMNYDKDHVHYYLKNKRVVSVSSINEQLKSLSFSQIEKVLGSPAKKWTASDQSTTFVYNLGKYNLEFESALIKDSPPYKFKVKLASSNY